MTSAMTVIVIAKQCLPGRVKTRLHPPLTLSQAADLAAASLRDTLRVVRDLPVSRRLLAFDGQPPADLPGFDVVAQPPGGLDERLASAFAACSGPTLLVGMDTPQLSRRILAPALGRWRRNDAWFGPATDGGFWALGLYDPDPGLLRGVPMSRPDTGRHQLERLTGAGLRVRSLGELRDVDEIADAEAVAAGAPDTEFARVLDSFRLAKL